MGNTISLGPSLGSSQILFARGILDLMLPQYPASLVHRNQECCWHCDYSLEKLPDAGRCLQCGRRYDQAAVVVNGRGRGDDLHPLESRRALTISLFGGLGALPAVLASELSPGMKWLILLAGISPLVAYSVARVWMRRTPRVQLVLGKVGFLLRSHPETAVSRQIYSNCMLLAYVPLLLAVGYAAWLKGGEELGKELMYLAVGLIVCATIVVVAYLFPRSSKPQIQLGDEQLEVTRWVSESVVTFMNLGVGKCLIRVQLNPSDESKVFHCISSRRKAELEVDMPDSRVLHIMNQLRAWGIESRVADSRRE